MGRGLSLKIFPFLCTCDDTSLKRSVDPVVSIVIYGESSQIPFQNVNAFALLGNGTSPAACNSNGLAPNPPDPVLTPRA